MREKFEFNKYNTDLDKKLKRLHGDSNSQKLARVAFAVILIVITAIIVTIMVKNKANEIKNDIINEMPTINTETIKKDIENGISSGAEDVKNSISDGIQSIFSNNK